MGCNRRSPREAPQVRVGRCRISMVVEGSQGAGLAIECDGDSYHGIDKFADDMQRQRVLKRAAGVFWRCFASDLIRRWNEVLTIWRLRRQSKESSRLRHKRSRGSRVVSGVASSDWHHRRARCPGKGGSDPRRASAALAIWAAKPPKLRGRSRLPWTCGPPKRAAFSALCIGSPMV